MLSARIASEQAASEGRLRWKEDCRRRYYALTPHGRTVAELQLQHLEALLKRARARQVLRDLFAARAAKAAEQPGTR